jgi:hypothetical protein
MSIYFLLIINGFKYAALAVGIMALLRAPVSTFWLKSLIAATFSIFGLYLLAVCRYELFALDYKFFWKAGCDVWSGVDPYSPERFSEHPFLNPPTALPLFALFAALPIQASLGSWTILNVAFNLGLIALARNALVAQSGLHLGGKQVQPELGRLTLIDMAGLAVCFTCSEASLKGFILGQLSVFVAVMILIALVAQGLGRPIMAGVCFSLATVKFVTMVPFLILFLRRADRLTWVVLIAVVLGLCAATSRITELPARAATLAQRVEDLAASGKVNDYSYEGTRNESIISFEHLFYRLGMRDRGRIRSAQVLALLTVGTWVAYLVILKGLPRPAAACVVSFFSLLFLYHRDYDTVILALPLAYCAEKVRVTTGLLRWLYTACGLIAIAILYADALFLRLLTQRSLGWETWGPLVQATVLPYATWLSLLAMLLLAWATRIESELCRNDKLAT